MAISAGSLQALPTKDSPTGSPFAVCTPQMAGMATAAGDEKLLP